MMKLSSVIWLTLTIVFATSQMLQAQELAGAIGDELPADETAIAVETLKTNLNILKDAKDQLVKLDLVKVTSVRSQVVAGQLLHIEGIFRDENDKLFNCYVTLLDQPWMASSNQQYTLKLISKTEIVTTVGGSRKPKKTSTEANDECDEDEERSTEVVDSSYESSSSSSSEASSESCD